MLWVVWVADTGHILPLVPCSYLFSALWTGATYSQLCSFTKRLSLEIRVYLPLCFAIAAPVIPLSKWSLSLDWEVSGVILSPSVGLDSSPVPPPRPPPRGDMLFH